MSIHDLEENIVISVSDFLVEEKLVKEQNRYNFVEKKTSITKKNVQ